VVDPSFMVKDGGMVSKSALPARRTIQKKAIQKIRIFFILNLLFKVFSSDSSKKLYGIIHTFENMLKGTHAFLLVFFFHT
jgi:hypothetical protein